MISKSVYKFSLAAFKARLIEPTMFVDQATLARWAIECAERVLPFFKDQNPEDTRPRKALDTLQLWLDTGDFNMAVIRGASLASHAAARDVGKDNPARSAARAAGQAVATAHVSTHAMGAAMYALQAIFREVQPNEAEAAVEAELIWQLGRLQELSDAPHQ